MFKKIFNKNSNNISGYGNVVIGNNNGIRNSKIVSMIASDNSVTINGETFEVPNGASISMTNNKVIINGKEMNLNKKGDYINKIEIQGNVTNVSSAIDISIVGEVNGSVSAGRDVDIEGNISNGDVRASRDIDINGKVNGSVSAGRDVVARR